MADRRVALLRGINVGRAKRVAMADLRALVAELGYGDVRTVLNSGNVVFTVPDRRRGDPAERIEQAVASRLGVSSLVTVVTARELDGIRAEDPLGRVATNPSRYLVAFFRNPAHVTRLAPLVSQGWEPERLAAGARVAYLWCPDGIAVSRLMEAVGRAAGDGITVRNWSTVMRLAALASSG